MNSCRGNSFLWYYTDYSIRNLNSKERISGCAYRLKSEKRQIGIWRRVAADNALRTAGGHFTSFGPLDRNCVGYIE